MRTPEEILSYGKDVIQKHRHQLYELKNGYTTEVTDDSNDQKFNYNDYGIWKYEVKDYIAKHEKNKIFEINKLFDSFELNNFSPVYLSDILGILTISIDHLESGENGESPDNSQTAQTTNETESHNEFEPKPEPIAANPPEEKKKKIKWKVLFCIIAAFAAFVVAFYYYRIDIKTASSIATIIGAIFAVLSFFFK